MAGELAAARERDDALRSARLELVDLLDRQQLGAEAARLVVRAAREVGAGEAVREAEVVLDPRALAGLAAGRLALHEHGAQPLGRAVHRRREPGRPAADDDRGRRSRARPGSRCRAASASSSGVGASSTAPSRRNIAGSRSAADAGDVEQPARLGVAVEVEPLVGDPVAGEQVARLVRGGREAVADDPHLGVGSRGVGLPVAEQVLERRVQPLLRRVPRLLQVVVDLRAVDRVRSRRPCRRRRSAGRAWPSGTARAPTRAARRPVIPGIRWSASTSASASPRLRSSRSVSRASAPEPARSTR